MNKLAGFFHSQIAAMQEGGSASPTVVARQFSDVAEVGKMLKESVSVEQGQLLRAVKPDQCVLELNAKSVPETPTQRQRDVLELTHLQLISWFSAYVYGKDVDDRATTVLTDEGRIR